MHWMIQKDNYSCGAIAIVNAIKWAGNTSVNDQDLVSQIKLIAKTSERGPGGGNGGTSHKNIHKVLCDRPEFWVKDRIMNPSIKDVKHHIDAGGAVVLSIKNYRQKKSGHAMLVVDRTPKSYKIVNWSNHFGPINVSSTELAKRLRAGKRSYWTGQAWLLIKNNNWKNNER